jgi:hypothetical protein
MHDYWKASVSCPNPLFTRFGRLNCALPEFSGGYVDSTGVLHMYLTDLRASKRASQLVHYEYDLHHVGTPPIRFFPSNYSYRAFASFYARLFPYLGPGLRSTGMDEHKNRLRIQFLTEDALHQVEAAVKHEKIPPDAVYLEVSGL